MHGNAVSLFLPGKRLREGIMKLTAATVKYVCIYSVHRVDVDAECNSEVDGQYNYNYSPFRRLHQSNPH